MIFDFPVDGSPFLPARSPETWGLGSALTSPVSVRRPPLMYPIWDVLCFDSVPTRQCYQINLFTVQHSRDDKFTRPANFYHYQLLALISIFARRAWAKSDLARLTVIKFSLETG